MPQAESIEEMLARLMPPAISGEGQRSLDAMLDELCGEEIPETAEAKAKVVRWKIAVPAGIAAAAAFAATFPLIKSQEAPPAPVAAVKPVPEMVLMGESGRIEKTTDEGWVADSQGGTMQAVRVRVVEENTLRDRETGIVVHISEPREELLLFPVNAF